MKVLIVDDARLDRELISRMLRVAFPGVEVVVAESPNEALLAVIQGGIDCILLDYQMPAVDGLELARKLQALRPESLPPLIMLTGEGSERVAAEAMKLGCSDYLRKADLDRDTLASAIKRARVEYDQALQERERREQLEFQALYDELTGLGNRSLFHRMLNGTMASARKAHQRFALCMIDLDGFKRVNDECGHQAGDSVLSQVAAKMKRAMRAEDNVFRVGGDEFAAILREESMPSGIRIAGQRILRSLVDRLSSEVGPIDLGASIGIALFPDHAQSARDLIKLADEAMYQAKREGSGVRIANEPEWGHFRHLSDLGAAYRTVH